MIPPRFVAALALMLDGSNHKPWHDRGQCTNGQTCDKIIDQLQEIAEGKPVKDIESRWPYYIKGPS